MDQTLKTLLNNFPSTSNNNKKANIAAQKAKGANLEECSKNLFSLPSLVLSENFAEKLKKENLQTNENKDKAKNESKPLIQKVSNSSNSALKNLLNEKPAKNLSTKNSAKNSLTKNQTEKVDLYSIDQTIKKTITNESLKDFNISSIEETADEFSKMNMNNSIANILSIETNSKFKNNNLISNINEKNLNNLININNSNLNSKIINFQDAYDSKSPQTEESVGNGKMQRDFSTEPVKTTITKSTNPDTRQNWLLSPEGIIQEENLTVVPKPKNLNISSYVERKVDLYSNLYQLKLTKNYNLYSYFVEFQGDTEHINTFLKKKIISKACRELIPLFGVYLFAGENLYATNKYTEVINIISTYNKVRYSFLIRPLADFIEMKDYDANQKNKCLFKNILELIYKDILKANPDVKITKNMCGKKFTEKIISTNKNKVLIIPTFSTKIMLLEAGIFLNVDNKNKILNGEDCLKLIHDKLKNKARATPNEIKILNEAFKERIVETKHTNQKFKIDSICFDRTPKNTNLTYDGIFLFLIILSILGICICFSFEFYFTL